MNERVAEMLQATSTSLWKHRYEISADGQPVAEWSASAWRAGGTIQLDGQQYTVHANMWGNTYGMAASDGPPLATANSVGRQRWTVESAGQTYELQRASLWRHEQELRSGDERIGYVRRRSAWRSDAVADLPGLPLPVQVFVLAVVLTTWDRASDSAGGAAAATG